LGRLFAISDPPFTNYNGGPLFWGRTNIVNVIAMKSTTLGQQLTNHGGQLRRIEYDLLPRPGIIKIIYKGREKFVMGKP